MYAWQVLNIVYISEIFSYEKVGGGYKYVLHLKYVLKQHSTRQLRTNLFVWAVFEWGLMSMDNGEC